MFTGLVQAVGDIASLHAGRLVVRAPFEADGEPLSLGESVAVNGCCLTVVAIEGELLSFDLSAETQSRTTLGQLAPGAPVNLERALRLSDRLGGHLMQGHVDGVATYLAFEPQSNGGARLVVEVPQFGEPLLAEKGSIALDGVSLTIVEPVGARFECWLIPETLRRTTLGQARAGQSANVEFDMLAKHVARLMRYDLGAI